MIVLLKCIDPGVVARRDVFRQQADAAPPPTLSALLFKTAVPYTLGVCFSCGDPTGERCFGRCWRCSLGMRLALGWPVCPDLVAALDHAKIA